MAAFAQATWLRVFTFQLTGAVVALALVLLSAQMTWVPTVEQALGQLPDTGAEIRSGRLSWPAHESRLWAERPQLALGVVPPGGTPLGLNSDMQVEFRGDSVWLRGLLGVASLPYPNDLDLKLTRTTGPAAWEAWRPVFFTLLGCSACLLHLCVTWAAGVAVLLPVWAAIALSRGTVGFVVAAKISLMSTQTALLFGWFAVFCYSARAISLSALGLGLGLIPVLVVVWCAWAIVALPANSPKASASGAQNPFAERK